MLPLATIFLHFKLTIEINCDIYCIAASSAAVDSVNALCNMNHFCLFLITPKLIEDRIGMGPNLFLMDKYLPNCKSN